MSEQQPVETCIVLLAGPLVYGEVEDRLRDTKTLVVVAEPEGLEAYCDNVAEKDPSLMPKGDRWYWEAIPLSEGVIEELAVPKEMAMTVSRGFEQRLVTLAQGTILFVCRAGTDVNAIGGAVGSMGMGRVVSVSAPL